MKQLSEELIRQSTAGEVKIYLNWEDFYESCKPQELKDYADKFHCETRKGLNQVELAILVWRGLWDIAELKPGAGAMPRIERGGKLANRDYVKVKDNELTPAELEERGRISLCPQARACLDLFLKQGLDHVSEAKMREIVIDGAHLLKTRQDPWRIWQYYRPQLIKARFLRLV